MSRLLPRPRVFYFDGQRGDVPQHAQPRSKGGEEGGDCRQAGKDPLPGAVDGENGLSQVRAKKRRVGERALLVRGLLNIGKIEPL